MRIDWRSLVPAAALALLASCSDDGGPAGPGEMGEGDAVAWFNGLAYTVDLYFPADGTLLHNAFVTGETPNDILPLGGGLFLTVSSASADISVYDLESAGQVASIELPAGSNPWAACLCGDEVFVTLLMTDSVAVVDTGTWTVTRSMYAGPNPSGIAVASGKLYVSHGNWPDPGCGGVTVLDPATGDSLAFVATPENTYSLRYHPSSGMIHSASSTYVNDGEINIIDPASDEITASIETGGSPVLGDLTDAGFTAGDGFSSGKVFVYQEDGALTEWETGHCVNGLAAWGDTLYMASFPDDIVLVGSLDSLEVTDILQAGDGPQGVAIISR